MSAYDNDSNSDDEDNFNSSAATVKSTSTLAGQRIDSPERRYEDDSPEEGYGERDTRYSDSPTRDTFDSGQNDSYHGAPSPEAGSPDEDDEEDASTESPFSNDQDSVTNQTATEFDERDLITTEKRKLAQIRAEKDSDLRERLAQQLTNDIERRKSAYQELQ